MASLGTRRSADALEELYGLLVWIGLLCEEQVRSVKRQVTVNLVSGNLMITFDAVFAACVHQHCGTDNVGVQENLRVLDGTVNMAFCCEVYKLYPDALPYKSACKRPHGL